MVHPGGVLLVCLGAFDEVSSAIRARFTEITGLSTDPVGLLWGDHDALDAELARLGARLRVLPAIPEEEEETLGAFLDEMEEGRWSWTWHVPEDVAATPSARSGPGPRSASDRSIASSGTRSRPSGGRTTCPARG